MNQKLAILISLYLALNIVYAIEKPSYEVVKALDENVEIRKYAPSKWVSTTMTAACQNIESKKSVLFQRLFAYITGANDQNKKIEMTAPVLTEIKGLNQKQENCQITMRFLVPKLNEINTPVPTVDAYLEQFNEMTVATIKFGGFATMNDFITNRLSLAQRLGSELQNYDMVNMLTAGYSSPKQTINRVNEVWLRKI